MCLMQAASSIGTISEDSLDRDLHLPDVEGPEESLGDSSFLGSAGSADLAQIYHAAQVVVERLQLELTRSQQQLAAAEHEMKFFRSAAADKDSHTKRLQSDLDRRDLCLSQSQSEVYTLSKKCSKLQQERDSTAAELADTQDALAGTQRELAGTRQELQKQTATCQDLQQQLHVMTQHFNDEAVRKGGDCTLAIKFDTTQRQQQYTHAVRSLLQPIEDKYVLDVELVQRPRACNFLLYVTFSSTVRLVNFDKDAFENFKQGCSAGEQMVHAQGTVQVWAFC